MLSLHVEEYDAGLFQSTLPSLPSRDLHVIGPHASLCFVVAFGEVWGVESGM